MPDERDKPVPGYMPHQMSGPFVQPWTATPPPAEPKGHGWDAAKVVGLLIAIGTIIFGAGAANEKLKNLEASRAADAEVAKQRTLLQDDRYEKFNSSMNRLSGQVESLTEEVKRARWQRRGRGRETAPTADDRP